MTMPPNPRRETVKALSWKLLFGNYRPRLGDQGWAELERSIAVPDFRNLDNDVDVEMEPFNQALAFIDRKLGTGDGAYIVEVAKLSVDRWASMFRNLVNQLQGRPNKMMEIFCREVHPYFLADPTASAIVAGDAAHAVVRLDNSLAEPFKVGLLEGFVEIAGAEAKVRRLDDGAYHVSWRIRQETPKPSLWSLFVNAVRLPFLTATLVPVLVGLAIAANDLRPAGHFDWVLAALTLVGVALFHLGTNTINDYFDHKSGADEANFTPTPFSGGSRTIQRGLMEANTMRNLAIVFYALGTLIGLFLVARRGTEILWLGLAGFFLGFLYSAPPVRLAHRGLGELAVAVGFGPLIVLGTYFVQTQQWSLEALLASLPVAFLIAAVLYINEFPDKQGDARVGKRTLIVRLPERAALLGYFVLIALTYLVILAGVVLPNPATGRPFFPVWTLLGLATLPLAIKASLVLGRNYRFPYRLIPANAFTILLHLSTGILFFTGYVLSIILA